MNNKLDLASLRARKARLGQQIGKRGYRVLASLSAICAVLAVFLYISTQPNGPLVITTFRPAFTAASLAILCALPALWYKFELASLPPKSPAGQLADVLAPSVLGALREPISPKPLWIAIDKEWTVRFLCHHLLFHQDTIAQALSEDASEMPHIWQKVAELFERAETTEIDAGMVATAIILCSEGLKPQLMARNVRETDILDLLDWIERQLTLIRTPRPFFGGVGRDWAAGFTPVLEHFSGNISHEVQAQGGYNGYVAHQDILSSLSNNLAQGSSVALVGPDGVGKSSLVYALAEQLLAGKIPHLKYYQIVNLNASLLLSSGGPKLEELVLTLFGEAVHAGNIILYVEDAQLFFGSGLGAFDMSQVLLPIARNRQLKLIVGFNPADWQQLRARQETLANNFAVVVLNEPNADETLKVVEDAGLRLEHRHGVLVSFEAIREAIRLSGQYIQEDAYPGKATNLLEQSLPYAEKHIISAATVQQALERMRGVRVSTADAPEAAMLLNLEDRIHSRMINQKQAVNVVAAALRRGRAGVANPKRPVGSFLFLGPTGVGKTELARSLAAIYFGDEHQMIRLDMSEYQRPEDVARLLSSGTQTARSLLMSIREQPFSVVLLDEVEKAHPNILNLLLQLLDEGQLTDETGKPASFRSSIIIATSNAGAADIAARVKANGSLDGFDRILIDKLIAAGQFRPELVNRFDEIVLFKPLNQTELSQVAALMLEEVNQTLAAQNIRVQLTSAALEHITKAGFDPQFGARPMRRIIQKTVENAVAVKILRGQAGPGSTILLDIGDLAADSKP